MASISPHKGGFRAQVYVKGERDSQTFRTEREVDAWAPALEPELRTTAAKPAGQRHSLRETFTKCREEASSG